MAAGDDTGTSVDVREAVVFLLDGQAYALPIDSVQEIQQIVAMNEVHDPTPGIVGLVNLRGSVVPAVDARRLLGMEDAAYRLDTPMVICRCAGTLVALLVDEVVDVATLPHGCLQSADEVYEMAERLIGVCRLDTGLVLLLDPDRLLTRRANSTPSKAEAAPKARRTRKKARE